MSDKCHEFNKNIHAKGILSLQLGYEALNILFQTLRHCYYNII